MKSTKAVLFTAALLSVPATFAVAQTNDADIATTTEPIEEEDEQDWGWIGLLGLAGLAGLLKKDKKHDDHAAPRRT